MCSVDLFQVSDLPVWSTPRDSACECIKRLQGGRKDAWDLGGEAPAVRWTHLIQKDAANDAFSAPVYFNSLEWVCASKPHPLYPPPNQMCQTHATKLRWPVPVPLPAAVPAVQGEKAEQHHRKRWTRQLLQTERSIIKGMLRQPAQPQL